MKNLLDLKRILLQIPDNELKENEIIFSTGEQSGVINELVKCEESLYFLEDYDDLDTKANLMKSYELSEKEFKSEATLEIRKGKYYFKIEM